MTNIHVLPTDQPSTICKVNNVLVLSKIGTITNDTKSLIRQNIYITSDEEVKERDWFLYDKTAIKYKSNGTEYHGGDLCHISGNHRYPVNNSKKIILTTNQDLIKNGVQAIDDEFLGWFVQNPSCEEVEIKKDEFYSKNDFINGRDAITYNYKIIIPKEEAINPNNQEVMFHEEHQEYFYEDFIDGKFVIVWLGKDYIPKEETKQETKDLNYWKNNAEEDYLHVPISVLRYISELEEQQEIMYSEEEVETIAKDAYTMGRNNLLIGVFNKWFEQFKKK